MGEPNRVLMIDVAGCRGSFGKHFRNDVARARTGCLSR